MPAVLLLLLLMLVLAPGGVVDAAREAAAPRQTPAARDTRTIYLALLSKGTAWAPDGSPELQRLQQTHADYLAKLTLAGQIVANGPVGDESDLRGLVMLTAANLDEARQLMSDDPAVKAGRLAAEVVMMAVPGPFGIAPVKDDMAVRQFVVGLLNAQPGATDERGGDPARQAYFSRLRDSGLLVFAAEGPDRRRRGLLVFASDNPAAVKALAADDPAVKAGLVAVEWHTWYAPDGVLRINKTGS